MGLRNQRRVVQVNRKLRVCGDVGKKLPRRGRGPKCNISSTHYNELPARFFPSCPFGRRGDRREKFSALWDLLVLASVSLHNPRTSRSIGLKEV